MQKTIKVGFMPGVLTEVTFETPFTVAQAIDLVPGLTTEGYTIKIDGAEYSLEDKIPSSARVIALAKKVKGNSALVIKVGYMPGVLTEYQFETPVTVKEILEFAGLTTEGYTAKLDGRDVEMDKVLSAGGGRVLALAKKVKGN